MPVTLERKPLVEALRLLRQVVQARSTIPILGNLLLDADDGMLRMTATDLERWLTVAVEATDIGAPMRLTVPAARLSAFVGALAAGSEI
ncbi:MAG: DNA polymerase III subunit beta, partial [Alphaproteobacteria bacterium]